uniref:Uncharacterized protein n=1 Tax=Setaria digitata TaxID=48799 RepID=A0A915PM94_9BILA
MRKRAVGEANAASEDDAQEGEGVRQTDDSCSDTCSLLVTIPTKRGRIGPLRCGDKGLEESFASTWRFLSAIFVHGQVIPEAAYPK